MIQKGLQTEQSNQLRQMLKEHKVNVQTVPADRLQSFSRVNHQGVVAFLSPGHYLSLEEVVRNVYESGEMPFFMLFDGLTDVRNFGAIARSALAAGAHGLILPMNGSVQLTGDAVKTSAGALMHIPVCRVGGLGWAIRYLKDSGIKTIALSEKNPTPYYTLKLNEPLALLLGSEDQGISPALLTMCEDHALIPMAGNINSLNVSVAAGVMAFEVLRQRSI
jgi:23S rRNA (guanosine2251-2'-O)-methyltransferase